MRFLLDENLSPRLEDSLRSDGHDVISMANGALRGASDEAVWELAARESRILVTLDLDFPLASWPGPAGLIILRVPPSFRSHETTDLVLGLIRNQSEAALLGRITVLSPGRETRVRDL
jgi:hypothetical protein